MVSVLHHAKFAFFCFCSWTQGTLAVFKPSLIDILQVGCRIKFHWFVFRACKINRFASFPFPFFIMRKTMKVMKKAKKAAAPAPAMNYFYLREYWVQFHPSIPVQMKSTTKARLLYMLQKKREERQHSLAPRLKTVKKVKLESTEGRWRGIGSFHFFSEHVFL